jgi:hypothetical protein
MSVDGGSTGGGKSRGSDTPTSMSSSASSSRAESRRSSGEWRGMGLVITPSNAALLTVNNGQGGNGMDVPVGVNLSRRPSYTGLQVGDPSQVRRGSFSSTSRKSSNVDDMPQVSPQSGDDSSSGGSASSIRSMPRRGSLRPAPPRVGSRTDIDNIPPVTPSNATSAGRASRRSSANGTLVLAALAQSNSMDGSTDAAPSLTTPSSDRGTPLAGLSSLSTHSSDNLRIVVDDGEERTPLNRVGSLTGATHTAAPSGVTLPAPAGGSRPQSRRGSFTRPPALGVSPMATILANQMLSPQRPTPVRSLLSEARHNSNSSRDSRENNSDVSGHHHSDILSMLDSSLGLLDSAREGLNPEIMRQMLLGLRDKILRSPPPQMPMTPSGTSRAQAEAAAAAAATAAQQHAKPLSFVQMIQACDIDDTTKSWLSLYTKEVPDESRISAASNAMLSGETKRPTGPSVPGSPMGSPSRSLALYQSADIGNFREWDWNIFAYDMHVCLFPSFAIICLCG